VSDDQGFDDEDWGDDAAFDSEFDTANAAASPLVGEAVRLFGVVQEWAKQTFPPPPSGHGGPECQWCPLCQFAAVLRGERPEITERVAEAGTALMSAAKAFMDAAVSAAPHDSGVHPHSEEDPAPRRPSPGGVQRIHLGGDEGLEADVDPGSAADDPAGFA
jgi:hypothetical protein